jgi:gliding motility-associated-like protein
MKKGLAYIMCLLMMVEVCHLRGQTIQLYSIAQARQLGGGDLGYTLDGKWMNKSSRLKILNKRYFGPAGIYPKTVNVIDTFVYSESLRGITKLPTSSLFFMGSFNRIEPAFEDFTGAELDSLYNWSVRGGRMIITSGLVATSGGFYSDYLDSRWNYEAALVPASSVIATPEGNNSGPFKGPFGTASNVMQGGGAQGVFYKTPDNIKVMAVSPSGRPTVYLDCKTLDLMVIDTDIFTELSLTAFWSNTDSVGHGATIVTLGLSNGDSIYLGNDRLWANSIAFMDKLQDPPVLVRNGNELSVADNYLNYQWYKNGEPINNSTGTTHNLEANDPNNYYVEVEVNGGCKVRSNEFSQECDMYVPTAFSPDNNGMNDKACVYSACLKQLSLRIFNRWGEMIFESDDKEKCWDGTYKGAKAESGVYAWTLEGTFATGKKVNQKGNITLVR